MLLQKSLLGACKLESYLYDELTCNDQAAPLCARQSRRTATATDLRTRAQPVVQCSRSWAQNWLPTVPKQHWAQAGRSSPQRCGTRHARCAQPAPDASHWGAGTALICQEPAPLPPCQPCAQAAESWVCVPGTHRCTGPGSGSPCKLAVAKGALPRWTKSKMVAGEEPRRGTQGVPEKHILQSSPLEGSSARWIASGRFLDGFGSKLWASSTAIQWCGHGIAKEEGPSGRRRAALNVSHGGPPPTPQIAPLQMRSFHHCWFASAVRSPLAFCKQ